MAIATETIVAEDFDDPATATDSLVPTSEDSPIPITLTGDDGDPELTQTLTFGLRLLPNMEH